LSKQIGVTTTEGNYLKFIYRKQVENGYRVGTKDLASFFKVNPATATETLQKLAGKKLLRYERYYGVKFTQKGITLAQNLLRKHRLLEVLLVNLLKYDAETACEEASTLDYHASQDLINCICWTYGHPEVCPCDKPIFKDMECCGS